MCACGCAPTTPCSCGTPTFTYQTGQSLAGSLAQQLIGVADTLRDLSTQFGLRPYNISIIVTAWSGGFRGEGVESVVSETRLLPTPKLSTLDSLSEIINSVGTDENGLVAISQISGSYSEYQLLGLGPQGEPVEQNQQVFYEVEYPRANGPGERRRFTPRSAPTYEADKFQWTIRLEKAVGNRDAAGDVPQ